MKHCFVQEMGFWCEIDTQFLGFRVCQYRFADVDGAL